MANKDPERKGLKEPWKPGQSGNPAGRPKGARGRASILKELLGLQMPRGKKNPLDEKDQNFTIEKAIDVALINRALKGDIRAIQEIKDSLYGKNPDIVQGDAENPIQHEHKGTIELKGKALIEELERRGLPTKFLDE